MYLIASISYAISIFIDVFSYHIKYNIHDLKNIRYLFSLINIFQFSARAFVLIFVPIMAYYTETLRNMNMVWEITFLSHLLVVLILLPLFSKKISYNCSRYIIEILNLLFGKSKNISFNYVKESNPNIGTVKHSYQKTYFFLLTFISGFLFSISITFLYYLSFFYPTKALTITSYSQILNMFGVLILVLLVDPKIMSSIDNGMGHEEIKLLTFSRVIVHISLMFILYIIK
jgi:hypothetical protein